jgi:protein kinase
MFMVFEYMDKDLSNLMSERMTTSFSEGEIRDIMYQLLKGVNYIHQNNYFHRDLKPENILVSDETFKISDFGLIK